MSSTIPSSPVSNSDADPVAAGCAAIFRSLNDLANSAEHHARPDAELLALPMEVFELDSLSTMEFVMAVEDRFDVQLDETAVNACGTIGDLAALVRRGLRPER